MNNAAKRLISPFARVYENYIVNRFHNLYYNGRYGDPKIFKRTTWMGVPCSKCPLDLWIYQEIVNELKPDLIIETGTYMGGSALFLAQMLDYIGKGAVVTIDIEDNPKAHRGTRLNLDSVGGLRPQHPRIEYISGSSTDPELLEDIARRYKRDTCMVLLDSDHSEAHVTRELGLLSSFVSLGSYMIVEDTNINGHPTFRRFGPGPYEAVQKFLRQSDEFEVDKTREKFLLTFNPMGFLKRVR